MTSQRENRSAMFQTAFAAAPWTRRSYKPTLEDLHYQINDLYMELLPKPEERIMRERAYYRVNQLLNAFTPGAEANIFGSTAMNMYLPNSDLDITVITYGNNVLCDLNLLAECFRASGQYSSIQVIEKATVPLIKLIEVTSHLHIDISFNVYSFYAVLYWVNIIRTECKYLDPLVLILKQFLHVHNLNCPFNGGITSYALVVMVSHFLKLVDMGQLTPKLQKAPLGALLVMFLHFYTAVLDYKTYAIAFGPANEPLIVPKEHLAYRSNSYLYPSILTIVDPVNYENDLGRGAYNMGSVHNCFQIALEMLLSNLRAVENESYSASCDEQFQPPPILALICPILPSDIIERGRAMRDYSYY